MKLVACLLLACAVVTQADRVLAQYTNVQVSLPGAASPNELTVAVNPTDITHVAAGANLRFFYASTDGGVTFGPDIPVTSIPDGWDFAVPVTLPCV